MFLLDDTVVTSASDLTAASKCEFAFLRTVDAKLGRIQLPDIQADAMYERTSRLGNEHEARVLQEYRDRFGAGVVEIPRPETMTRDGIEAVVNSTADAFSVGADVVFQATFFDPGGGRDPLSGTPTRLGFIGFADFIVREGGDGYLVQDTKLARTARVTALLQLAAYAERLEAFGVRVAERVQLLLGDGTISEHRLDDIVPVYRNRRARLERIILERIDDPNDDPVAWGDDRYTVCGHCDLCGVEIEEHRDVLLVAGMRVTQRARLAEADIRTIDALAESTGPVDGIAETTLQGLRIQARLQLDAVDGAPPPVTVFFPRALAALPEPDDGDIFFDFEGDPLYTEGPGAVPGRPTQWGLDYLFGLVDTRERFTAFWAHTFAAERTALRDFLDDLAIRRQKHPNMHVYHYASYERTHLLSIAARHGVAEDEVDNLLRDNVLVDLYPIVRRALRVGSRSYSIKKLEPLYMGEQVRESDVQSATASIDEYVAAMDARSVGATLESDRMLAQIGEYNAYDCLSTLRLRDWLLARAAESGVRLGADRRDERELRDEPSPLRDALLGLAGDLPDDPDAVATTTGPDATRPRTPDQTAAAFAAAAIDYHRREQKSFWWEHFARLIQPIEEWEDTRDVLVIERATLERDWFREEGQRTDRRQLRLRGRLAPGSRLKPDPRVGPFLLYEFPGPFPASRAEPGARSAHSVTILEAADDGSFLIEERVPPESGTYDALPSALTPTPPPNAGAQKPAIAEWGQSILDAQPGWPADPMMDLLRRIPPRTRSGVLTPAPDPDAVLDAVAATVSDLDGSYLAVQGPPGTGKTHLAAHLIARLVRERNWAVGVVAQSHAVVEHLLGRLVTEAGLNSDLVAKVPSSAGYPEGFVPSFTVLPANGQLIFAAEHAHSGFVVGGTAWDFSNAARVPRHSLDLLVIDEAGQFSLAATIAASVSARNVLLLGDPQQLPQVSQGVHPEPVDQSALGWISAGHDVLPPEFGYFLAESRRMHPAVTAPVSRLSYESKLRSHSCTRHRRLNGIEPGLHLVPVQHENNATESPEEAARVVTLVRELIGTPWSDPSAGRTDDPLRQTDLIVVTPYNAQLALVRAALDASGYPDVRVGTVDKFQGQEAVVAIISLAASSAADVPRGMAFLILKNRLNVAISRAQWAAYLVFSPGLADYLPRTPDALAELSAFITLTSSPREG